MKVMFIAILVSFFALSASLQANPPPAKAPSASVQTPSPKINLNTADLKTLTGSFKGIGKKRAEAIIAYRDSHHGFKAIEELAEVKGMGQHFMTANHDKLKDVFEVK